MTSKNVYHLIRNNKQTLLSTKIIDLLDIISVSDELSCDKSVNDVYPSEEKIHVDVISKNDSKDKLPTRINKYFINHIKELFIGLILPEYGYVLERMVEIKYFIYKDEPTKDDCIFSFMQFSAKGSNVDDMFTLYNAIREYSSKFLLEKFKSNLTYSFPVTCLLIDDLTDKTERYLHPITDLNFHVVQPECYLLRLGDFARDTFKLCEDNKVIEINEILLKHINNYEMIAAQHPDYLMLHIIET